MTLFIRVIFRHRKLFFEVYLYLISSHVFAYQMNGEVFIFKSSLRYIFVLNGLASMTWVWFLVKSTSLFFLFIKPTSFLELVFFHIMCVGCVHSILICSNTRDRMKSVTLLMRLLLFPQIRNTHCKKRFSYIFNLLLVCFFWQFIKCNHNFLLFWTRLTKNDILLLNSMTPLLPKA